MAVAGLDDAAALGALLLQLRERAEKALARPVTHAAVALDADGTGRAALGAAAAAAGLTLLRVIKAAEAAALAPGAAAADAPVLGAAIQAEDDAALLLR
jgi:molecular chaperone DnaK (HSP70)